MTTNFDMIGRDEVDDLEAILSITNSDVDEVVHTVRAEADALFTWDYERSRPALVKLYEKAKTSQWNAETDLDWSIEVDQAAVGSRTRRDGHARSRSTIELKGTARSRPGARTSGSSSVESLNWRMSQFLHGEQGALLCTAQDRRDRPVDRRQVLRGDAGDGRGPPRRGVRQVPRHQARGPLPDQRAPRSCSSTTSSRDSRWDMTYLGMQIMVEGLALAAFGFMHQMTTSRCSRSCSAT